MITAHFPSSYVLSRVLPQNRAVMIAALVGAVFPDLDLIWFYGIDDSAFHHHRYWPHIPMVWAIIAGVVLPLTAALARPWLGAVAAFLAAIFLHICLDSIAGDILWAWPWNDHLYHLITVKPRFGHWLWNFILHPVFLLEILIWAAALWLWRKQGQNND